MLKYSQYCSVWYLQRNLMFIWNRPLPVNTIVILYRIMKQQAIAAYKMWCVKSVISIVLYIILIVKDKSWPYLNDNYYKECAPFTRKVLGRLLYASSYSHERPSCSNRRPTVSQLSPTTKADRSNLPPHSVGCKLQAGICNCNCRAGESILVVVRP